MKLFIKIICVFRLTLIVNGASDLIITSNAEDNRKIDIIAKVIQLNLKNNGWNNIYIVGNVTDTLYSLLKTIPFTFTRSTVDRDDEYIEDVMPYYSNIIVISCLDFDEFEDAVRKATSSPYWHPIANIILDYHTPLSKERIAKIFFAFFFYRALNVVIVYRDKDQSIVISYYNHYMTENYKLKELFGCWTSSKVSLRIDKFETSLECVQDCQNVSLHSHLRAIHLGTCIGFNTHVITNESQIKTLNIFEDKGRNLHGYILRAYSVEVLPFLEIRDHDNRTFTLHSRDGMIWNTMAELLNFKIDLSPGQDVMKKKFDFEKNIVQLFDFLRRRGDLLLFPLYQFDLIVSGLDNTIPFMESGLCILSHRANYETVIFNIKLLEDNLRLIIRFSLCFLCTWLVFFLFNAEQFGKVTFDQAGKDLMNTFKTVLSLSLHCYPRKKSFLIFFFIAIWSFFVLNFSAQAAIISLFSAYKRGREVDTFDDVIEKGYKIEGLASPDIMLPHTDEKFNIINSKMEPIQDLFGCVKFMANDSERFCVIDCAVGRYLERNLLNDKGKQFLHIATKDRIHSHYLQMIFQQHSPLTEHYNKYILILIEAGLIRKWMEYKFTVIKEEVPLKALGMDDMEGIFKCFSLLLFVCVLVFLLEIFLGCLHYIKLKIKSLHGKLSYESLTQKFKNNIKIKKYNNRSTQTSE